MGAETDYRLTTSEADGRLTLAVAGGVAVTNAQQLLQELLPQVERKPRELALDLSKVDYFDSGGGAVLIRLRQRCKELGIPITVTGSTADIDGFLQLIDQEALAAASETTRVPEPAFAEQVGKAGLDLLADCRELAAFTGELFFGLLDAIRNPRLIRWRETLLYMQRTGVDGLPIVALISYLMGLITAFQAAIQLTQFGADIYIANLVGLSVVRELGPLMTSIIAAGRSGAAFAAEIGTMKVSEEVDAMTTMGFDRTRFLVTPKVMALVLMLPCLTLFADLVGILGGLTVAVFWLDLPATVYMRQTRISMGAWDVYSGLIKTIAFAILISGVGCLKGFQARGGAASVGQMTTSAIVASIFFIIVTDAVFTVLFHYW